MESNDILPRKRASTYASVSGSESGYERESGQTVSIYAQSGSVYGSDGRQGSLSPNKRRGSGGAYCVECNEWRHKFDFTKSQWRNRPRGFRRCKFCTGEVGSDSKQSPSEWSPTRCRLNSQTMNH